jgi:rhodanese-related sulfurtransferase
VTTPSIPEVHVDALASALDAGAAVLDVRMPDEYEESHVPGAVLVPLPELPDRLADIPEGEPLYVICRSGARSMSACELLAADGHSVANVAGGTLAWIESGRPVAIGAEPG